MNSLTSESIPYTCAVLNETLRLLSPIGANERKWMTISSTLKFHCRYMFQGYLKLKCHLLAELQHYPKIQSWKYLE